MAGTRVDLLVLQQEATWNKEEWFVPLAKALDGVGPAEAAWQPPGGGNTIWQTLTHCNYYNEQILRRLTGQPMLPQAADNTATFGAGNPEDAAGWQAEVERAHRVAEGLRAALAGLTEVDLDAERPNGGTLGQRLPLWVMHDAYHSGQIVLLRKMQGSWPANRE